MPQPGGGGPEQSGCRWRSGQEGELSSPLVGRWPGHSRRWNWTQAGGSEGKASACNVGDLGLISGSGISPGEGKVATHSSTLAWRIPWMEEPGRLQSMGLQSRIRLSDFTSPSMWGLLSWRGGQGRAGEQTQWEEGPCVQRGRLSWSALLSCAPAVCHHSPPASSSGLDIQMTSAPGWGRCCSREHQPGSSLLWTLFSILSSSQQELDRTSSTPPHHDHQCAPTSPGCQMLGALW